MNEQSSENTTRVLDLLDALPVMILDVDERGTLQFANRRARERLGLPADLDDILLADILDESCADDAANQLRDLFSGENDLTSSWRLKTAKGQLVQVDTNAVTIYDGGTPFRARFYLHDGSDPASVGVKGGGDGAEFKAALKEEQEYTKALIQKSGLLVYILDTRNNVVDINKKMEKVTGFNIKNTKTLDSLLSGLYPDPKYRDIVDRIHQNMYKNQHIRETELAISTATGESKHISWSTARLKNARGQVHGFIAMGMDVSEKKRLEQWVKLQSSCFDRVSDAVVVSDLKGQIINWVGGAERMLGFPAQEMVGKPLSVLYPEQYREDIEAAFEGAIERDKKWSSEMVMTTADGRHLSVRFDSAVILNEKNAPIAVVSILHDQTNEKRLEREIGEERAEAAELNRAVEQLEEELQSARDRVEELEQQVQFYSEKQRDIEQEANRLASGRVVLESAIKELQIFQLQILGMGLAAILTIDASGTVLTWSRGAEELVGLPDSQASGHHHDEVLRLEEVDWELLHSEALEKDRVSIPCTLIRSDDERVEVSLEISVLMDNDTPIGFAEIIVPKESGGGEKAVDVDKELFEASNLATVGYLTTGLARELADSFGSLGANFGRLREYTSDLKKVVELYRNGVSQRDIEAYVRRIDLRAILSDIDFLLDESSDNLVRVRALSRDLDSYLPEASDSSGTVRLNALIESAISLVQPRVDRHVRFEKNFDDALLVEGEWNPLLRAMVDLLIFCVGTGSGEDEGRITLEFHTAREGAHGVVGLRCPGEVPSGLLEHLENLTALALQSGFTALSLGVAHRLLKEQDAALEIDSAEDGYTTFTMRLRAVDLQAPELPEGRADNPEGRVLFVDHDKNQLRAYRRFFERRYEIFQADSAAEALNALTVRQDFDVAVLDFFTPESEGLRFCADMVSAHPDLATRIIVTLPPGMTREAKKELLDAGYILVPRPVDLESLSTLIAHVVRGRKHV